MNNSIEGQETFQEAFQKDFNALLEKHGAEICIEEDDANWTYYHPRHVIEVHKVATFEGHTYALFSPFNLDF